MQRRLTIILFIVLFQFNCLGGPYDKLVAAFKIPTEENHLFCYWYWINDDISKHGITKDLEAMKKAGIGAAFIGNINPALQDGKVPILSEDWWSHMVHAVNEGKRIGVDIGIFNCPGWSMSGGPWISADKAMRYLNYSETNLTGGKKLKVELPKPHEEFQDVYVLAFPKIKQEEAFLNHSNSRITVTPSLENAASLLDGNKETGVRFKEKEYTINIRAKKAITARSIKLLCAKNNLIIDCELKALIDGEYVSIKAFNFDRRISEDR